MKLRYNRSLPTHIPLLNMSLVEDQIIDVTDQRIIKKLKSTKLFDEVKEKKIKVEPKIIEEVINDNPTGL